MGGGGGGVGGGWGGHGTPGACRPGGWCRDYYPGALTLGRVTAAHLGIRCPRILLHI